MTKATLHSSSPARGQARARPGFPKALRVAVCALASGLIAATATSAPSVYPTGTTRYDPARAFNSFVLFTGGDNIAHLIDMNGNPVHEWKDAASHSTLIDPAVNAGKLGHVFVTLETTEGKGTGLVPGQINRRIAKTIGELDWEGKTVWSFGEKAPGGAAQQHHDWARLPNGNTFIDEGQSGRLFQVTPDGDIVWEYVNPYHKVGKDPVTGKATANPQLYRGQPVPYGWVPAGTPHSEKAVTPPELAQYRISAMP
jgi:hypothetical protein